MSDQKLISPLLDGFVMGDPLSSHDGVCCCPAMKENSDEKYIVKIISIPASQKELDALLLTGAYPDAASAVAYFKELTPEDDRYVPYEYTVTFDSNGAEAIAPVTVGYRKTLTAPVTPTRAEDAYYKAYTFDAWYLNGKAFDFTKFHVMLQRLLYLSRLFEGYRLHFIKAYIIKTC